MRVRHSIVTSMIEHQPFPQRLTFQGNITSVRRLFTCKLLAVKTWRPEFESQTKNHIVEDEGRLGLEKSWLACLSKIVGSRLYESSYLKNKMDNNRRQLILTSLLHKCSKGHLYELFSSYINNMVQHYFHKWIQFILTLIDFFYPLFCLFRIYFTYQPQFPSLPFSSFPS